MRRPSGKSRRTHEPDHVPEVWPAGGVNPGVPANFCTRCGTPTTSDAVRERIVDLMLQGIRDDMRKAVERLEHDEPEKYGRLAAIITGGSG
jgi:hypothetical protein